MKGAALLRVSTDRQDLDSQREAIRTWAEREGASVCWYEEPAISGAARDRPTLDQLVRDARRGRFDVLVIAALDRLARDVVRIVLTMDELEQAGVYVVSLREGLDFRGPMGRAMASLLGALAEIERAVIRERVLAGMKAAKARGKHVGRPRYLPTEKEIQEMLELRKRGHTIRQVAAKIRIFDQNGQAHEPSPGWVHRVIKEACSGRGGPCAPKEGR